MRRATPPGSPNTGWQALPAASATRAAQLSAHRDDLLAGLHADLADHAEHVALGGGRCRTDHEVRPAQEVEVQRVVLDHERGVDQFADLPGRGSGLHLVDSIHGLGGCHVVRGRADATDARSDLRHVFHGPPFGELLEAAQFRHLEVGPFHLPLFVEENVDLPVALQPRDRVDRNTSRGAFLQRTSDVASIFFLTSREAGRL